MSTELNDEKRLGSNWKKSTSVRKSTKYRVPEVEVNYYIFKEQKHAAIGIEYNVREMGTVVT